MFNDISLKGVCQMEKLTYSVREVSEILGIGIAAAYQLANSAGFPSLRVGKRILIPCQAFSKWLQNQADK